MGAPGVQPLHFDIYNIITDKQSVGTLNQGLNYPGIISVKNKIYVAGGELNSGGGLSKQVSLLEW
jgi:N-acetylneuraminic acid mutarotase